VLDVIADQMIELGVEGAEAIDRIIGMDFGKVKKPTLVKLVDMI
jgi:hypothetical protein